MKAKIISGGLYIDGLRRIKVPSIIFAAIIFLMQFIVPLLSAAQLSDYRGGGIVVGAGEIVNGLSLVSCIMTPILVLVAFYSFNVRSSSDFYQSLPYTRTCIFFSWLLAALTVSAGLILIGTGLGYGVRAMFPGLYILSGAGLGDVLLSAFAAMIFAAGCVLVAMSVTGIFISNAVCALLLMFLPRMILFLIRILIIEVTPVLNSDYFMSWMNIEYNSFVSGLGTGFMNLMGSDGFWLDNIGADIFTVVVGLCYIALAALLFKFRKSETASQGGSSRLVQHIIRIALTFAVSLLGTYMMVEEGEDAFAIVIYVIALIVFFAYEIITTKKWINLLKCLPTVLIVVVLNVAVWLTATGCSSAIANNEIDPANVRSVRVLNLVSNDDSNYFNNNCNELDITDPEVIKIVTDAYNEDLSYMKNYYYEGSTEVYDEDGVMVRAYKTSKTIVINTGSGTIYRWVRFTKQQLSGIVAGYSKAGYEDAIKNIPEAVDGTLTVTLGSGSPYYTGEGIGEFSAGQAEEIHRLMKSELAAMDYEKLISAELEEGSYSSESMIVGYRDTSASHNYVSIGIYQDTMPETYNYILKAIYEVQSVGDAKDLIAAVNGESDYEYTWFFADGTASWTDDNADVENIDFEAGYGDEGVEAFAEMLESALSSSEVPEIGKWMYVNYSFALEKDIDQGVDYREANGILVLPVSEENVELLRKFETNNEEYFVEN